MIVGSGIQVPPASTSGACQSFDLCVATTFPVPAREEFAQETRLLHDSAAMHPGWLTLTLPIPWR